MFAVILISAILLLPLYLWHINRAVATAPLEALNLSEPKWTKQEIEETYRKAQKSPIDVKPFLFPKKSRRYIVTGGSGLVGGWIVEHLLMRGEDPNAIRILDLKQTTRPDAVRANIDCVITDVSDIDAVMEGFRKPWSDKVKSLPLTVFHCVAYVYCYENKPQYLPIYIKVNVLGTENVLQVARGMGASCFIGTSSGSVSVAPPSFFTYPWQRWPDRIYQFLPNAEPKALDAPLDAFASCYSWSKAQAEKVVREANNPQAGFLTGALRPANAIYGHGVDNYTSLSWDVLRRGGTPTWMKGIVSNFVLAQNVSIGHLAYENALVTGKHSGGKAYCITDPNPPVRYQHFYDAITTLAHPLTPQHFPTVPFVMMLLIGYVVEAYITTQRRFPFLPVLKGDLAFARPAMFNTSSAHTVFTDTAAQEEIGYRAPYTTLEGFALTMLDWNTKVEEKTKRKVDQGKGAEVHVQESEVVPKGPVAH